MAFNLVPIPECARLTGYAVQTIHQLRMYGRFIEPVAVVSGVPLFDPAAVKKWKQDRERAKRRKSK